MPYKANITTIIPVPLPPENIKIQTAVTLL